MISLSIKIGNYFSGESQLVRRAGILIRKGVRLKIFDPEVRISQPIGANKRFIEKVILHIGSLSFENVALAMRGAPMVAFGLSGKEMTEQVTAQSNDNQRFLDFVGIHDPSRLNGSVTGIC